VGVSLKEIMLGGEMRLGVVITDLTERKQAEAELRKAHDELELRVQKRTEELRMANSELEEEIIERKQAEAALQAANRELTHFNSIMVGRELRMIELKKEVNQLCEGASLPPRYGINFEKRGTSYGK
jgi:phosphoglycerate-specific signal transduction histidine kinase